MTGDTAGDGVRAVPAKRERQRASILTVSRALLEAEGVKAVTIRRLAEAIDRTQPAIYAHFSSKEALVAELVTEGFAKLLSAMTTARDANPGADLEAVSEAYRRFGTDNANLYDVMFVSDTTVVFASDRMPAAARGAFDVLKGVCRPAIGRSSTSDDDDTRTEVYWSALHGLVMLGNSRRLRPDARYVAARMQALLALLHFPQSEGTRGAFHA